ncbi:MAG: 3'-5' exonuclease [bacterium]|nr:3'-5' exonuclease [bacterium]
MKYIAYDFETTGLDYQKDQPIEIGIIKIDNLGNIEEHNFFAKAPEPLSDDTKRITGLTDELINEKGIDLQKAMEKMFEIMGIRKDGFDKDVTIIGHNIICFDNLFLYRYAGEYGYRFPARENFFDTAGEFRALLIGEQKFVHECDFDFHDRILKMNVKGARYNLTAACKHYGINMDKDAHRALHDSLYSLKVFEKQTGLSLLKYVAKEQKANSDFTNNLAIKHDENGQGMMNF